MRVLHKKAYTLFLSFCLVAGLSLSEGYLGSLSLRRIAIYNIMTTLTTELNKKFKLSWVMFLLGFNNGGLHGESETLIGNRQLSSSWITVQVTYLIIDDS